MLVLSQHRQLALLVVGALLALSTSASAQQIFFGEDINLTATGQNENAVRIPHPNSDAARISFFSNLSGVVTETFEQYAPNASISTLTFGPDTATLSPSLQVLSLPTGTLNGAYPISGNQFLLQNALGANTFSIAFSSPQAAFGLYVTDLEVQGNLTLRFLLSDGVTTIDRPIPTQVNPTVNDNHTGSVLYWGVIDTGNPFTRVTFVRNLNAGDGFGFDDMTIARTTQVVPEPQTYALMAIGLTFLGLAGVRKKRVI
jgi:hypothetical protein